MSKTALQTNTSKLKLYVLYFQYCLYNVTICMLLFNLYKLCCVEDVEKHYKDAYDDGKQTEGKTVREIIAGKQF